MPNGYLVNKAGSYLLGLACKDKNGPLYVCCEEFKLRRDCMATLRHEDMDVEELGFSLHENVSVRNVYFDITPVSLITGWISEKGLKKV